MAPNLLGNSTLFHSAEPVQIISKPDAKYQVRQDRRPQVQPKWQIVWKNVLIFTYLHIAAFYGIYYLMAAAQWKTILWCYSVIVFSGFGVTCGAHRLWAHRAYKARLPLRVLLAVLQTAALQNDIYEWVRDHRVHHKFTDTDADPHNSNRGFFFSHMGWLLVKKHRDVFVKGKTVDMSDVAADPVVRFQRKYYVILAPILCFLVPALVPFYLWDENTAVCWYSVAILRYLINLHGTWSVNSAAHIWGTKPFEKNMNATENKTVAIVALGEGWHNYHHVFPWDYKAAELGNYRLNFSTAFIDLMAKIGWAYDLKTVSVDMVAKRANRTGDGTRKYENCTVREENGHHSENHIWGWDDGDMSQDDRKMAEIHHSRSAKAK